MSLPHTINRVRFDIRRRRVTVHAIERVTPNMLRITFTSPDLGDFESPSPDDHIKIFVPDATGAVVMRDYTPRSFDRDTRTLVIDFALHEAGPATLWAMMAQLGDQLDIAGPRGAVVVPDDFDWYLLISDETGLPAIGRWLESLRTEVTAITVISIDSIAEAQTFDTAANWRPHWVCRGDDGGVDDAHRLLRALEALTWPEGDGYVWIAAEALVAKAIRRYVVEERKHPMQWLRASGYWLRGQPGATERLD